MRGPLNRGPLTNPYETCWKPAAHCPTPGDGPREAHRGLDDDHLGAYSTVYRIISYHSRLSYIILYTISCYSILYHVILFCVYIYIYIYIYICARPSYPRVSRDNGSDCDGEKTWKQDLNTETMRSCYFLLNSADVTFRPLIEHYSMLVS